MSCYKIYEKENPNLVFFPNNKDIFLKKCYTLHDFDIWQALSFTFGSWTKKLNLKTSEKEYYLENHDLYIVYDRNSTNQMSQIIGVFTIFNCYSYYYLWNLGIEKNKRNKGYASQILQFVIEKYKDIVFTVDDNDLLPFYKKKLNECKRRFIKVDEVYDENDELYTTENLYTTHQDKFTLKILSEIIKEANDNIRNCCGLFVD